MSIWYCPNLPPYPSTTMAYAEPAVMFTCTDPEPFTQTEAAKII